MDRPLTARGRTARLTAGLSDTRTWRAFAYVLVTAVTTLGLFVATLALILPALVLCVVGVGFALTVAAMAVLDRLTGFERHRAGWVGVSAGDRPLSGGSLMSRFRDPDRWRIVGFGLTGWFIALLALVGVLVAWSVPLYMLSIPLWGWAIDSFSVVEIVGQAIAGAGLLMVAPWVTQKIGALLARFVEVCTGPGRVGIMQRQVADLTENRDEILIAVAGERRRIERNLHDGVQQQLVALGIDLGLAESKVESDPEAARLLLAEATKRTRESIGELRSIGRGLHPAILGDRGLDAALSAVAANSSVPLELRYTAQVEPPPALAEAAYFIISEATTNIMKHSEANLSVVEVTGDSTHLALTIYDDGRGGASLTGTGLAGIAARVRGLNGSFDVSSPRGGPTTVVAILPYP